jgi:hypothetical protein
MALNPNTDLNFGIDPTGAVNSIKGRSPLAIMATSLAAAASDDSDRARSRLPLLRRRP